MQEPQWIAGQLLAGNLNDVSRAGQASVRVPHGPFGLQLRSRASVSRHMLTRHVPVRT
jgi:hypothetical protein